MKILFVVEHFYPYLGGAEELFLNLTVSLAAKGHEIVVVTTLYDNKLQSEEYKNGVRIIRVKCYNRFLFTVFSIPAIIKHCKGADVIHTTSYNSALPAFLVGKIRRKKLIITFHELWGKLWFKMPFTGRFVLYAYYLFEKMISSLPFDKYVAVSDYTAEALRKRGIKSDRIVRIYNGLNYDDFQKYRFEPPVGFTFCFFGRLGISKGLDILIPAAEKFIDRNPESKFKIIIPDYPRNLYLKVRSLLKNLENKGNLILLHNLKRDELFHQITTSSCVTVPSVSEGFCFVAAETVALGVPVISSGKGALTEVIGGKYIELNALTTDNLVGALNRAKKNEWDFKPAHSFKLSDSVEQYLKLYGSFFTGSSYSQTG